MRGEITLAGKAFGRKFRPTMSGSSSGDRGGRDQSQSDVTDARVMEECSNDIVHSYMLN